MESCDARIERLWREIEEREREIRRLKEEKNMASSNEDRIAELETKVRELEALTRGLTDELLDLKSIVMKLSARSEERRPPVASRPAPVAPQKAAAPPAPEEKGSLEMIMQADGTLKPERRTNEGVIVASGRYNPKGARKTGDKEEVPLIVATEDDSTSDDSVVIRKK